jgi:hypothetical protein
MVHSGYEASAVDDTFGSLAGIFRAAKATLFGGTYADDAAAELLKQPVSLGQEQIVPLTINNSQREMETV